MANPEEICICGHGKSFHINFPKGWEDVSKCKGDGYHEVEEPYPTGLPDDFPKAIENNCLCKGFKVKRP